jgi:hypothetical protein
VHGADVVLLEPDALAAEPHALQHLSEPVVRRLVVGVVDLGPLNPRIPSRQAVGDLLEDDDRRAVARPDDHDAAHGVGEVEMPRERTWIGEAREVGEVHSGARDDGGEAVAVQVGCCRWLLISHKRPLR